MGRMIYTRVVFDMSTGEVLEQKGFWWEGPIAVSYTHLRSHETSQDRGLRHML